MRTITLTQPWATLVAIGAKQIETRSWSTAYRGPLAIHAAKGLGPVGGKSGYLEFCTANEYVYAALHNAGLVPFEWDADALLALPFGKIVAVCELVECKPTGSIHEHFEAWHVEGRRKLWFLTDQERAMGDYSRGRFAWLLDGISMLAKPVPAKGGLGLWEWSAS